MTPFVSVGCDRARATLRVASMALILATASLPAQAADGASAPTHTPPEHQDLLYLGARRPVVIRLHLLVNGEPFGRPWDQYARQLFSAADHNGDGRLTQDEQQAAPAPDDPLSSELIAVLSSPGLRQADVAPPDGVLSVAEFAAFVTETRGGAFQSPRNISSAPDPQALPPSPMQMANAGAALFKALDVHGDGRLSVDDLRNAAESLRKLDFDSDGACSAEELDHLRNPYAGVAQAARSAAPAGIPLQVRSAGELSTVLVERLLLAYGGNPAALPDALSIQQLGHAADDLADFDADHDGRLDLDELRYWITHVPPHVELLVRIGATGLDAPPIEVSAPPRLEDLAVRVTPSGLVSLVDGAVQLEFGVRHDDRTEEGLRQAFVQSFKMFDVDGNGYLDRSEAARAPYFDAQFSRFDRDADAKVFEEELLTCAAVEIRVALSRTSMTVDNRGQDLFQILDTSRDRRVSRRELLESVERFSLWDANADEDLAPVEVPQLYQLQFERGAPPLPSLIGANRSDRSAGAVPQGPVWFQRMDRNADGDVAREEFIGTPEQFQTLDINGDGLLDVSEAVLAKRRD